MAGTTLSLRQLLRHVPVTLTQPLGLRALLRRPSGPLRLDVRPAPFSVIAHNMALLVAPGDYLGTDRDGVVTEICARIRTHTPDVVGLCEVFSDGEREEIRGALNDLYPHFREGPDEADLESDGGLLLLSRHPLLAADDFIYRDCDGDDCYANKGMIHIRVQSGSWPTPIDIFHTHAQDISTDDGVDTLYAQLLKMQEFIQSRANPAFPAIVMGDLNIPGEIPQHYARLLSSLAGRGTAGRSLETLPPAARPRSGTATSMRMMTIVPHRTSASTTCCFGPATARSRLSPAWTFSSSLVTADSSPTTSAFAPCSRSRRVYSHERKDDTCRAL